MTLSEELDVKYHAVKADIIAGMGVSAALMKHKLDHGSYYGRRDKDPDPIKKSAGTWSRKPRVPKAPPTVLTVPLKSKAPSDNEKIVAIVCQPSQLKTILEGLNE